MGTLTDTAGDSFSNFTFANTGGNFQLTATSGLLDLTRTLVITYPNTSTTPATVNTTYSTLLGLGGSTPTTGVAVTSAAAPCFASGTLIRTERGDVPVEDLRVGECVVTASGVARPIRWIGHRKVDCLNHPRPGEALPVRIAAGAFAEGVPARDLFVSPGHSICIEVVGEVLVPAIALVNGNTVRQVEVDSVTYWHVELESHDILLAENMPAESYLNMNNRGFFQDAKVIDLSVGPDYNAGNITHADFCRPFHDGGPVVEAIRAQLCKRATNAGWTLTNALDLHLEVDGRRLDPIVRDLTIRFALPAEAADVWLVSPTARPSETLGIWDDRNLGLYIASMRIEDGLSAPRDVAIDDPLLCVGFHAVEGGSCRWTAGRARLPQDLWQGCEDGFYLKIELAGNAVPRWVRPDEVPSVVGRPALALVA